MKNQKNSLIKSKQRVAERGEVFTDEKEVSDMLDLVEQETARIDSRFLEPACGTGNFLIEILRRKLQVVRNRYSRNQLEYERYSVTAVSSLYGIDILEDNVEACRQNLLNLFEEKYVVIYKNKVKTNVLQTVEFILSKNIVWGDALTMKTPEEPAAPLKFSEWSRPRNDSRMKRSEYYFEELTPSSDNSLFDEQLISDTGGSVFIPKTIREYPVVHFLEIHIDANN